MAWASLSCCGADDCTLTAEDEARLLGEVRENAAQIGAELRSLSPGRRGCRGHGCPDDDGMRCYIAVIALGLLAACGGGSRSPDGARFVHVGGLQSIATWRVDAAGTLHAMGVVQSPYGLHDVVVRPDGRFVYAAGFGDANVLQFQADPGTGRLTYVGASASIPEGGRSIDLAMHPSGRWLVAVFTRDSDTEYLASFRIDAATGTLQRVGDRQLAGAAPEDLEFDFTGSLLFVTQQGTESSSAFGFDPWTGSLGPARSQSGLRAPGSQGTVGPFEVRVSGIGVRSWVADRTRDELRTFGFEGTTGSTVEIAPPLALGLTHGWSQLSHRMLVAPSARQAWIADYDQLLVLALDAEGVPSVVDRTSVWSHAGYLATDPAASHLFAGGTAAGGAWLGTYTGVVFGPKALPGFLAGDERDHLGNYRLEAGTGRLEWTSFHRTGDHITAIAVAAGPPVVAEARQLLTVTTAASGVSRVGIDRASGALSAATTVATAAAPTALTVAADGRFVFVAHGADGLVVPWSAASGGALTPGTGTVTVGTELVALASEPQGRFLFAAHRAQPTVATLTIAADGALAASSSRSVLLPPVAVVVTPSGRNLISLGAGGELTVAGIAPDSGALTVSSAVVYGTSGGGLAVDPTGQHVYVASPAEHVVRTLRLATTTVGFPGVTADRLFEIGTPAATGLTPGAVVVHPSGQFVYVAHSGSDDVAVFRRDPETGLLTGVGLRRPVGADPTALAVAADGHALYIASGGSNEVAAFTVDAATGTLSALGAPQPVGGVPAGLVVLTDYH